MDKLFAINNPATFRKHFVKTLQTGALAIEPMAPDRDGNTMTDYNFLG